MSNAPDVRAKLTVWGRLRKAHRGVVAWFNSHPWVWVVPTFCLGGLFGLAGALYAFKIELGQGWDSLLGAALGAAITVGWAGWLATGSARKEDRLLRQEVLRATSRIRRFKVPTELALTATEQALQGVYMDLIGFPETCRRAANVLSELRPLLHKHPATFLVAREIEDRLERMRIDAESCIKHAEGPLIGDVPDGPDLGSVVELVNLELLSLRSRQAVTESLLRRLR